MGPKKQRYDTSATYRANQENPLRGRRWRRQNKVRGVTARGNLQRLHARKQPLRETPLASRQVMGGGCPGRETGKKACGLLDRSLKGAKTRKGPREKKSRGGSNMKTANQIGDKKKKGTRVWATIRDGNKPYFRSVVSYFGTTRGRGAEGSTSKDVVKTRKKPPENASRRP